jgi:phage terminase Nu1 subunit (DNA packaging protein)
MTAELPDYYFRVRENGATVFRISTENRQRRIDMDEIATVNVKNGNIKPHGDVTLSNPDLQAIETWIAERQAQLAARAVDDILRTVDHLNLTTQWAQAQATDDQLEAVTDRLLLTMHDLRTVLVRKKADRLGKSAD